MRGLSDKICRPVALLSILSCILFRADLPADSLLSILFKGMNLTDSGGRIFHCRRASPVVSPSAATRSALFGLQMASLALSFLSRPSKMVNCLFCLGNEDKQFSLLSYGMGLLESCSECREKGHCCSLHLI